ncbi:RyR domain-containing protein [Streptomyces sp. NBS 14/10]|uniref:RyR domain-containing protein n=1 Tax=Streptomyces sp. NBS 14/10 TaxID=1945643 RepID=UPI0015C5E0B7|nr:RyR domain-containing protein [Streptomyces sp. NBS 14/10]KAK1180557.1 RyR domain-containing protein [Streptomyces sp. NBS 14/10]
MSSTHPGRPTIVVSGDPVIDWATLRLPHLPENVKSRRLEVPAGVCWLPGGALLLAQAVKAVANRMGFGDVRSLKPLDLNSHPTQEQMQFHQSYPLIREFPSPESKYTTWRVAEFLGATARRKVLPGDEFRVQDDPKEAEVVVLDDANLGFREHRELWPQGITDVNSRPWTVLKMGAGLAEGALWESLRYGHLVNRLVVVTTANDLRYGDVEVSCNLSWEHSARDVAAELIHKPSVNALSGCPLVVVSFGPVAALVLKRVSGGRPADRWKFRLIFQPESIESWERKEEGRMWGYTSVLTAWIACYLAKNPDDLTGVEAGVRHGLAAMQELHSSGYQRDANGRLRFPSEKISDISDSMANSDRLAEVVVPAPLVTRGEYLKGKEQISGPRLWTILQDNYPDNLDRLARDIVKSGADHVLKKVPRARFRNLMAIDRVEIETFRSIRALIAEYCRRDSQTPLSLAVFGAPGSGKSFAVTEIVSSLEESGELGEIRPLTFNLSQFSSPADLVAALHAVRDVVPKKGMPLVFWDEFDTPLDGAKFGWLRYFLAPMQDGKFNDGNYVHPIGKSIFVFAGGTSRRMAEFRDKTEAKPNSKGPDFLSRIRGYIDLRGTDPVTAQETNNPEREVDKRPEEQEANLRLAEDDTYYIVRRAVLLRSLLEKKAGSLFRNIDDRKELGIDDGILRAFLEIPKYEHGARSMEAIIEMSSLTGERRFERSALPSQSQLDLHVDGHEFLAIMRSVDLPSSLGQSALAVLAQEARNQLYDATKGRQGLIGDEYKSGQFATDPVGDGSAPNKQYLKFVENIPNMLGDAGYRIVLAHGQTGDTLTEEAISRLAEAEHNRWMNDGLRAGWSHGEFYDSVRKLHPAMKTWANLSDGQKQLDRERVGRIPAILENKSYVIECYVD